MMTVKARSPAFQFYPADFLASARVALLSLEAKGAYIIALCYCWLHGSIPSNLEKLARLIGGGASTTLASEVAAMFSPHPTDPAALIHERLELEREKQRNWREKSARGGRKSAEMRESRTVVQPPPLPNGSKQKATLPSSVFSLQSSSSNNTIQGAAVAAPERKRNELLDCLATVDGGSPEQVTRPAWGAASRALAEIKRVSPELTADEIRRRAEHYRAHFPFVAISASALSKHWSRCDKPPAATTPRFYKPAPTAAEYTDESGWGK